ncbi:MAG: DUF5684 domain-containing protein [Thermoleophilia bacterium]
MEVSGNLSAGPFIALLLFTAAVYVYYSFSLMTIAHKTDTESAWMAWVPIFNIYLMCRIADKPGWWLLVIMFVPFVNLVLTIILWMRIAEVRGFPNWWGLLMLVPVVNFIVPGYLAFAEGHEVPRATPIHH